MARPTSLRWHRISGTQRRGPGGDAMDPRAAAPEKSYLFCVNFFSSETVSLWRPLRRRAARTARPVREAIRSRKPCFRLRGMRLGCHVRLGTVLLLGLVQSPPRSRGAATPWAPGLMTMGKASLNPCSARTQKIRRAAADETQKYKAPGVAGSNSAHGCAASADRTCGPSPLPYSRAEMPQAEGGYSVEAQGDGKADNNQGNRIG